MKQLSAFVILLGAAACGGANPPPAAPAPAPTTIATAAPPPTAPSPPPPADPTINGGDGSDGSDSSTCSCDPDNHELRACDADVCDRVMGGLIGSGAGGITGGFGYGGSGSGGNNTNIGSLGTVGHGKGTGAGYGITGGNGGGHRSSSTPTVSLGTPTVRGNLDPAIVRRYLKRNITKLQYCYEKALLADAKLKGTVTAKFSIASNGTVTDGMVAAGVSKEVSDCVTQVVSGIEFPKPKGDKAVTVTFSLVMRMSGS